MSEWSVEKTEDIRDVDARKKPAADAPFNEPDEENKGRRLPGREKGSEGEFEEEPDKDKEASP